MKFDFWTFTFQIINFTVLLFILRRVLFRPIREIMEKRRAQVAQVVEDADRAKREAEALKDTRTRELAELRASSTRMMDEAKGEAETERKRIVAGAEADSRKVIEKDRALFESEKKRAAEALKEMAVETVSAYARTIMKDASDQELHGALTRRFMDEAARISQDIQKAAPKTETPSLELASAFPVDDSLKAEMKKKFEELLSRGVELRLTVDPALIAGVVLRANDLVFDMSLAGQIGALKMRLREKVL